uniref:Uncharacterized protein n=1 Tax=Hucho hucho TaxID=62062 RepID=A0A4W5JLP9_9TELE
CGKQPRRGNSATKLVKKATSLLVAEKEYFDYEYRIFRYESAFSSQNLCKELQIDVVVEERYNIGNLTMKITEVRVSAEAMLGALLGAKVKPAVVHACPRKNACTLSGFWTGSRLPMCEMTSARHPSER